MKEKPVAWVMSWACTLELGFSNGTYLLRRAARLLYPEYFDENGEPRLDMLPVDEGERK